MTAAQLADKLLADEHADVLCETVAWLVTELMEAEGSAQLGAELGERSLERATHRNRSRPRDGDTRVGWIELAIPSCAKPAISPASWSAPAGRAGPGRGRPGGRRQRRLHPQGRPPGRPARPAPQDQGPALAAGRAVRVFRERPGGADLSLWLDAKVEGSASRAGPAQGAGDRRRGAPQRPPRVIGLDVGEAETEAFWRAFLRSLPAVAWTASSSPSPTRTPAQAGDHPGAGWAWQRCCVQVLRDMLGHLARAQQPLGSGAIGGSFTATTAAARMWGDLPNHAALLRLAGMLLLEQNDEWLVGRCYLSETAMALVMATDHPASSPQPAPR